MGRAQTYVQGKGEQYGHGSREGDICLDAVPFHRAQNARPGQQSLWKQ